MFRAVLHACTFEWASFSFVVAPARPFVLHGCPRRSPRARGPVALSHAPASPTSPPDAPPVRFFFPRSPRSTTVPLLASLLRRTVASDVALGVWRRRTSAMCDRRRDVDTAAHNRLSDAPAGRDARGRPGTTAAVATQAPARRRPLRANFTSESRSRRCCDCSDSVRKRSRNSNVRGGVGKHLFHHNGKFTMICAIPIVNRKGVVPHTRRERVRKSESDFETRIWRLRLGDSDLETQFWRLRFGDSDLETQTWRF